jgi:hypothetical protein
MSSAAIGDPRLPDRFWRKVVEEPDGCWHWTACRSSNGYGKVSSGGRSSYAHRVAHEALVGPIAEGMTLDHLCRVRHCVRPDHAEQVPNRENLRRGTSPTAENGRKTHCAREGHPLSGDNLYVNPRGERECRACRAAANARHDAKRRAR